MGRGVVLAAAERGWRRAHVSSLLILVGRLTRSLSGLRSHDRSICAVAEADPLDERGIRQTQRVLVVSSTLKEMHSPLLYMGLARWAATLKENGTITLWVSFFVSILCSACARRP